MSAMMQCKRNAICVGLVGFLLLLLACGENDPEHARMMRSARKCFGQYPNAKVFPGGGGMAFDLPVAGLCMFSVDSQENPADLRGEKVTQNSVRYHRRWGDGESFSYLTLKYAYKERHVASLVWQLPRSLSSVKRREIENAAESCLLGYVRDLESR